MRIHVLIKDYGGEGFTVHGATTSGDVAQAWESAESSCKRIELDTEASIDASGISFAEKL
jgi:hypothetical protein